MQYHIFCSFDAGEPKLRELEIIRATNRAVLYVLACVGSSYS